MLLNLFRSGFSRDSLVMVFLSVPVILFSLSFHEFSHALVANWLGDKTARNLGRMSLNPAKHLDLVGTIMMLVVGFGYAKPVPINSRNFKSPKWGMALSALAGPVSNLLLAFISTFLFYPAFYGYVESRSNIMFIIYLFFLVMAEMNVTLAVFNLLPIPPLDGSRILFTFLPTKAYFAVMKYERYISIALIIVVLTGGLSGVLSSVSNGILSGFARLAELVYG